MVKHTKAFIYEIKSINVHFQKNYRKGKCTEYNIINILLKA